MSAGLTAVLRAATATCGGSQTPADDPANGVVRYSHRTAPHRTCGGPPQAAAQRGWTPSRTTCSRYTPHTHSVGRVLAVGLRRESDLARVASPGDLPLSIPACTRKKIAAVAAAISAARGAENQFDEVKFEEGEWYDYDEKKACETSITNIQVQFKRA
eukprot:gene27938-28002_t